MFKRLELNRVTLGVEEEHGGLFVGFAREADVWLDDEVSAGRLHAVCQFVPLFHGEHDAEVAAGEVVAVNLASFRHRAFVGRGVGRVITRYCVGPTARQPVNLVHIVSRPHRPSRVRRIGCRARGWW